MFLGLQVALALGALGFGAFKIHSCAQYRRGKAAGEAELRKRIQKESEKIVAAKKKQNARIKKEDAKKLEKAKPSTEGLRDLLR